MQIIVKTAPKELLRARKWWNDLEMQWKFAYNEAVFGKGTVLEPPKDDELMILLIRANILRFAGPGAINPNMSTKLTNMSGLIPLYHLKTLSFTNTRITNVKELIRHTQIENLFLYENQITSLEGLEGMKNLKTLYINSNSIKSLTPLKNLNQIEELQAQHNELENFEGITDKHADSIRKFIVLPNGNLKDKEIIKFQNSVGLICR